jgi:hypothetical protein
MSVSTLCPPGADMCFRTGAQADAYRASTGAVPWIDYVPSWFTGDAQQAKFVGQIAGSFRERGRTEVTNEFGLPAFNATEELPPADPAGTADFLGGLNPKIAIAIAVALVAALYFLKKG